MKPPKVITYSILSVLIFFSIVDYFRGGIVFTLLQRYTFFVLMGLSVGCILWYFVKDVLMQKTIKRQVKK